METRILTLFTRTSLHVGAGNSVGAVDSPVMRERHTRFPNVPGSSLKGVLRDLWRADDLEIHWLFGSEQNETTQGALSAGALLVGEARLLAFPVRSAKGGFAWLTSPLALARFKRDADADFALPKVAAESCLASQEISLDDTVILEEYCLARTGEPDSDLIAELKDLADDDVWQDLAKRLAVVSDEMLSYFAENACEVVTRIRINDETGAVAKGALFNQEQVPSETLFYTALKAQEEKGANLSERKNAAQALDRLDAKLAEPTVSGTIQVGGDATIGLGWCSVKLSAKPE